jgi:uncharacterized membrane protein
MKQAGFIKTAVIGGIFVLMPVVVVVVLVGKAFGMLGKLGAAVASKAPVGLDHLPVATGLTVVVLVGLCYGLGRIVVPRHDLSKGTPVERAFLNRIPGYEIVRGIAMSLFGFEGAKVKPALLRREEGVAEIVLAVEALPGDRHVVFMPECPVPMTGTLLVVDDRLLEFLPASSASVLKVFSGWGGGAAKALAVGDSSKDNVGHE